MRIDLKALLLLATSTDSGPVVRLQKQLRDGKFSYAVRYYLQDGHLVIRRVKRRPTTATWTMRVRRCRRRLRQRLRLELQNKVPPKNRSIAVETEVVPRKSVAVATKVPQTSCSTSMEARHSTVDEATETKTQKFQTKNVGTEGTRVEHNTVGVGTRTIELETTASQSPHQEWANNQVDTFDLILTFSSEQQTYNAVTQPSSSQTEVLVQSRSTQVEVNAKVAISQTSLNSFSIGNQTERLGIGNAWVQTLVDSQDGMTQTTDDEEDVIKPHLKALYLIHESIRGQSDIIHNGVLEAINQLMDVVLLGMKKSKMEDQISKNSPISVPADPMEEHDSMENLSGSMKNEKPFSSTSLIKPTSKSLYSSGDQVDLIPNSRSGESSSETKDKPSLQLSMEVFGFVTKPKRYQRGKRIVAGQSWHCSRRCIRCGMYNHLTRTKESVPTNSQDTQTEATEQKDVGLQIAVVCLEFGVQTERDRPRWSLRRA